MRVLIKDTKIKKIIIVIITIVLLSNFIMPNYVCAISTKDIGKRVVGGFFYLLAYVGDGLIILMQKIMVGTNEIKDGDEFAIKYSPGVIFSNTVPALDINFIGADENSNMHIEGTAPNITSEDDLINWIDSLEQLSASDFELYFEFEGNPKDEDTEYWSNCGFGRPGNFPSLGSPYIVAYRSSGDSYWSRLSHLIPHSEGDIYSCKTMYMWSYNGYLYMWCEFPDSTNTFVTNRIHRAAINQIVESTDLESTAYAMKENIASWYVALRTIALVGLLSVLLYIGIRIVLKSTSAQDKAKYKNMLKDWVVALCILFVLHYIMAFMLNMTGSLNNIIKGDVISTETGGRNKDILMSSIRQAVGDDIEEASYSTAGYTIMYLALVLLTAIFTLQYLKRVIFMAFLTMIAPMIALTYPLDRIKDGKAQAFSYWVKEYIFNCLIQPVHLLLYTILISNAIDLATSNWLYAIVSLAFLVPAEKFVKEMFGLKSQSSAGTLGAAAGGAMVMSMLNKIKAKPPQEAGQTGGTGGAGGKNKVRTKSSTTRTSTSENIGEVTENSRIHTSEALDNIGGNTGNNSTSSGTTGGTSGASGGYNIGRGLASAIAPNGVKGIAGSIGKNGARSVGGILTGAATGTIALATKVATGDILEDPGKALTDIGVTAGVGYAAGKNFTGSTIAKARGTIEKIEKVVVGEENYNNKQFDKQFFKSSEYKQIEQDSTILRLFNGDKTEIKEATQQFLNEAITDATEIRKSLQQNISAERYVELKKAGIDNAKKMSKIQTSQQLRNLRGSALKQRIILANSVKNTGLQGENFIRFAKNIGIENEEEIAKLQAQIGELLLIL